MRDRGLDGLEQAVVECAPHRAVARATGDAEEVLFVVCGAGDLWTGGERHALEPETGVNLGPGQEYELRNEASDPMRTVSVRIRAKPPPVAPAPGDPAPLAHADAHAHAHAQAPVSASADGVGPTSGTPVTGPARIMVRRLADQQAHGATTEREFRIVADPSTGLRAATHFVGYVPPGRAPDHFHTYDEVIYVLDGEGAFHVGGTSRALGPGSCIELPARTVHCLENTGDEVLRLVAVFRPAGSPAAAYFPDGTPAYPGTPSLKT